MHLRHKMAINTRSTFRIVLVDVVLKLREAQLISIFEVTVIGSMLLNGIIRQVHESIVDVLKVYAEFSWRCSQVTFFEEEQVVVLV